MLQFSLSKRKCKRANQALYYKEITINDFFKLTDYVCIPDVPWSPNIFKGGYRCGENYLHSDLLVLDYDNGKPTLDEACSWFKEQGYRHIIGTTKSHQIEKVNNDTGNVSPACDRYRVIIHAQGFADNIKQINYQMTDVKHSMLGIDRSCAEGARFFWPCKTIVQAYDGKPYKAIKAISLEKIDDAWKKSCKELEELGESGWIPDEVLYFCKNGADKGDRRPSLFRHSCKLTRMKWDDNKIITKLYNANFNREKLSHDDIMRHIERGILYAKTKS